MLRDKEWRLAFKFISMFFLFVIAIWLIVRLAPLITIFVTAVLIVYSINPLVKALVKKKIPPFIAAGSVSIFLLLIMFLFLYMLVPTILTEINQLTRYLITDFEDTLLYLLNELEKMDMHFNLTLTDDLMEFTGDFINQIPYYLQQLFFQITAISINLLSRIWAILGLLFLIFYLVQDLERTKKSFTRLFPQIYHDNISHVISVIDEKVGAYIRGNILRCGIVGFLAWLALFIIGMPFSLMLGALAGVFNIILYIGPFIAAIPAVIISLSPATPHPLVIISIYIAVQILDAFILSPVLLGKAVNLRPLTIIVVLLIGGQLLGFLGVIIAIPVTAVLKVLIHHYYLKDKNLDLL